MDELVYLSISINSLPVRRIQEIVDALANLGLLKDASFYMSESIVDEEPTDA